MKPIICGLVVFGVVSWMSVLLAHATSVAMEGGGLAMLIFVAGMLGTCTTVVTFIREADEAERRHKITMQSMRDER